MQFFNNYMIFLYELPLDWSSYYYYYYLLDSETQWRQYKDTDEYFDNICTINQIIICSWEQRQQLSAKLQSMQKHTQIIVFCYSSQYDQMIQSNQNQQYQLVTNNFQQIIAFLKRTKIFNLKIDHQDHFSFRYICQQNRRISKCLSTKYTVLDNNNSLQSTQQLLLIASDQKQQAYSLNNLIQNIGKILKTSFEPISQWKHFISIVSEKIKFFNIKTSLFNHKFTKVDEQLEDLSPGSIIQKFKKQMHKQIKQYQCLFRQILKKQTNNQSIVNFAQVNAMICLCFLSIFNGLYPLQKSTYILQLSDASNINYNDLKQGSKITNTNFVLLKRNDVKSKKIQLKNKLKTNKKPLSIQLQVDQQSNLYPYFLPYFFIQEKSSENRQIVLAPFTEIIITNFQFNNENQPNKSRIKAKINYKSQQFLEHFLHINETFWKSIQAQSSDNHLKMKIKRMKLLNNVIASQKDQLSWLQMEKGYVQYMRILKFYENEENIDCQLINQVKIQMVQLLVKMKNFEEAANNLKQILSKNSFFKDKCQNIVLRIKSSINQQKWASLAVLLESNSQNQNINKKREIFQQKVQNKQQ